MWFSIAIATFSQEEIKPLSQEDYKFLMKEDIEPFKQLGVSVKLSPSLGYGLEASTSLHKAFNLRLGVNLTKGFKAGRHNIEIEYKDENDIFDRFGYLPEFRMRPEPNFIHGNLLLDYHFEGEFHLTTGVFIGTSKIKMPGYLVDQKNVRSDVLPGKEWPILNIDKIVEIPDGKGTGELRMGNAIKPYLGIGFGRVISEKKISFKFEVGALYQGNSYVSKVNGIMLDLPNSNDKRLRTLHQILNQYLHVWPQMNFQLTYRIF
jgi:hypothetical protein